MNTDVVLEDEKRKAHRDRGEPSESESEPKYASRRKGKMKTEKNRLPR